MKNLLKTFYKNNFVYSGKEKLSKLTILFIIILNLFVFITIGLGIDFQIKVLNNPNIKFSSQCRNIISSKRINDFNNYLYNYETYDSKYKNIENAEQDLRCNILINKKLKVVKDEHNIKILKKKEKKIYSEQLKVNDEISYLKENYNTVLFEKLSSQELSKSIIRDNISSENIKSKYNQYIKQKEDLKKQKEILHKNFKDSKSVKEFTRYIKINKKQIEDDYKRESKNYRIKKELITLLFLFPLLYLSFHMMKKYLTSEKYTLYIMFKNIVYIILIPTIISFLSLIYILLPKIFIEKVLNFFYELEVPFIVYYFTIVLFILIFGYIIVKVQKRYRDNLKSLEKNSISNIESFNKSICFKCQNKVDYQNMKFCPSCKNELIIQCPKCNKETIKNLNYCIHCASALNQ